jgi:hypothetical protein
MLSYLRHKILLSQMIEHYAVYYGLNSYLAGFIAGYAKQNKKEQYCYREIEKIIQEQMKELENETTRLYGSVKITEVFKGVSKLAFTIGEDISNIIK